MKQKHQVVTFLLKLVSELQFVDTSSTFFFIGLYEDAFVT